MKYGLNLKISAIILVLCMPVPQRAAAGDYMLSVCAGQQSDQNQPASYTAVSPSELSENIFLYFHGQPVSIEILPAALANGHVSFCSSDEKQIFINSLLAVIDFEEIKNESHLYDFMMMYGSQAMYEHVLGLSNQAEPGTRKDRLKRAAQRMNFNGRYNYPVTDHKQSGRVRQAHVFAP